MYRLVAHCDPSFTVPLLASFLRTPSLAIPHTAAGRSRAACAASTATTARCRSRTSSSAGSTLAVTTIPPSWRSPTRSATTAAGGAITGAGIIKRAPSGLPGLTTLPPIAAGSARLLRASPDTRSLAAAAVRAMPCPPPPPPGRPTACARACACDCGLTTTMPVWCPANDRVGVI